jgi:ferredoxin
MDDVYQQLAQHLDNLPAGFPPTETGVEMRILKRLFSPEEAKIACHVNMMRQPASIIAQRMGKDEAELAPVLENMAKKGLLFRTAKDQQKQYMAAQFVIGIWEYHLNDLDPGLIRDVNEYMPNLAKSLWTEKNTKQLRVIPVSQSLDAEITVMPYEVAEEIIKTTSKIVVAPCICRREHEMVGQGCGKPMEVCLSFETGALFYEENGLGRPITREEALDLLKTGMDAGLVLQPGNAKKPANLCMCCGCCCQVLKNLKKMDRPARLVHTNFYARVDARQCTACGACVDRCQMDAIRIEETAEIISDRCIGCGLCVTECPTNAIGLNLKKDADRYVPPANSFKTYLKIARERGKL